jgi:hypothetical protein
MLMLVIVHFSPTLPYPHADRSDGSYLYVLAVRQLIKHRQWVAELHQHQQQQQVAFRANDKSARLFAQRNNRLIAEVCVCVCARAPARSLLYIDTSLDFHTCSTRISSASACRVSELSSPPV